MTRRSWLALGPSLLVGSGIVLSTWLGKFSGMLLAGPLLLAASMVGADMLESRMRGKFSQPSWAVLIVAGSLILTSLIMGNGNPMKDFMPFIAAASWTSLLIYHEGQHKTCRNH